MTIPNTAQATGPMTLESGLTALKAKMASSNTKADDFVNTLNDDGTTPDDEVVEQLEPEADLQETTEAVSTDEPAVETEEPDTRPIILPDGSEVTVEEARKGYLRQAEFTRKTQDVARERDSLAAEKQAAAQQLGGLYQQLSQLQETEPNWLELSQNSTAEDYQRTQAYWQHKKAVMGQAQKVLEETRHRALQSEKANAFRTLNEGKFEPAWKDEKVLKQALDTVASYAVDRGLPEEVIPGITNPTIIEILEESRRYRELQKAKPKAALAVKGKPAPFKPGAKSTASPQTENIRLLNDAFRKNPSVDNAVRLQKAKAAAR